MENPAPRSYSKLWQSAILLIVIGVVVLVLLNRFKDPETVSYGLLSQAAEGNNIYIAQNQAGTGDGSTCGNAKPVIFFNTQSNWGTGAEQISPGTTVHLCGVIANSLKVMGSGVSGSPIRILFEPDAKISSPIWEMVSWNRAGLWTGPSKYIVIDGGVNGVIESTDNGTERANKVDQIGVWLYNCSNCEVKNLTISGAYVRTPLSGDSGAGTGISAAGGNTLLYNNKILEAATGIGYSYPGNSTTTNVKIYNNHISRISNGITFGSGNTNAVGDNVEIYGNDISDAYVWDGIRTSDNHWFHSDGIQLWAVHAGSLLTNVKIYSNYVHGDMGRHITGWIFVEGNIPDAQIYNNLLVSTGTSYASNGMITGSGKIYNNTIATLNTPGICVNSGVRSSIQNNILYNCGTGVAIHSPDANTVIDYNIYKVSGAFNNATVDPNGGAFRFVSSLGSWQSLGFDFNSKVLDPLIVDPTQGNFKLQSTSPAIDIGTNAVSSVVVNDKDGVLRPQGLAWDIGAYEYSTGTTPPPPPPTPTPPPSPVTLTISSVSITTNANSATIKWTTNVPSKASIYYGTSSNNLNLSTSETSYTTTHTLTIPNLTKSSRYFYQIRSANVDGTSTANSSIGNFRTKNK